MKKLLVLFFLFLAAAALAGERLYLQDKLVDSSGTALTGAVEDVHNGQFSMKLSTIAAVEDSNWATFRLGPMLSEGVTAILGYLQLEYYSDTGSIADDTLTCRLFTTHDPDNSALALAAIDSNKFTGTGVWNINIDNDTIFKKWLYIDMEAITPDNCDNDSADYQTAIDYRVKCEIIKQKFE